MNKLITMGHSSSAWQAILAHCAKLSEREQQAADDELYDHVDPHF